ncbi:predicted protein [Arabidopsis lyrata subsp. lyrata]|uniref:Predicted protein n=1 Tax=Arabidopsis lyrata subsp. lyrata TaxID=81972 RepID=D7KMV6_ARALL|nr:predicted protein [Arabidopsis lyrata subsp. lyrata]
MYVGDESVDALGGQTQPILVDVEVNQMDGREDTTTFDEGEEECGKLRGQKGTTSQGWGQSAEMSLELTESLGPPKGQNQPILVEVEVERKVETCQSNWGRPE